LVSKQFGTRLPLFSCLAIDFLCVCLKGALSIYPSALSVSPIRIPLPVHVSQNNHDRHHSFLSSSSQHLVFLPPAVRCLLSTRCLPFFPGILSLYRFSQLVCLFMLETEGRQRVGEARHRQDNGQTKGIQRADRGRVEARQRAGRGQAEGRQSVSRGRQRTDRG
jgi:hypothetical protein